MFGPSVAMTTLCMTGVGHIYECRTGREMHVTTGSPQNFKVDVCEAHALNQGCLWGGPPARRIRPIDLRARPIRVKWALTDRPW
jgi:hypothetical protein